MKMPRTFGVEIELNGEAANTYPTSRRIRCLNSGITFDLPTAWKYVRDVSCGIEFVSPPMCDTALLSPVIDSIKNSGIRYGFNRTGLHVHVGAWDLDIERVRNVAKFCRHFDRTIFSLVSPERINNKYCRPLRMGDRELEAASPDKENIFTERYKGCNLEAMPKHGTIEFRYAAGTLDFGHIESMVELYTHIVEFISTRDSAFVNSPKPIKEKRVFLLDLLEISKVSRERLLNRATKDDVEMAV